MAARKIIVLGGGVAGLSTAHELVRRSGSGVDFEIHVYERRANATGGKARSIPVPRSATGGRAPLPGEHGFRFFPGFYRHLPDTLAHIPYGSASVLDNLVVADRLDIARFDAAPIVVASRFPRSLGDIETDFKAMFDGHVGLLPGEIEFFAARIWQVLTSCQARRLAEYERISWWTYLQADQHSPAYRNLLVSGLSRSLLANDPRHASVRTVGDTNVQLLLGMLEPGHPVDRLLNGPTSKVWLDPWRHDLEARGVRFHLGASAEQLLVEQGRLSAVRISGASGDRLEQADACVCALPVERMATLLRSSGEGPASPLSADPSLAHIITLSRNVCWMNGIQFFLLNDVPIVSGHMLFVDSPWALTGISEAQFWRDEHLADCGDGRVRGILSACISEWNTPGILYGLPANQCTRQQIVEEVWAQIKRSVNVAGRDLLVDSNIHSWFLDPDIEELPGGGVRYADAEPLFVNHVDSWALRPEATTAIPNLFLASDYVRTFTDVACMEAANEAARRAVNGLLAWSGSSADPCALWPLHEPDLFAPFRWHDAHRFEQGLPWDGRI